LAIDKNADNEIYLDDRFEAHKYISVSEQFTSSFKSYYNY